MSDKRRLYPSPSGLSAFLKKSFPHGAANKILAEYHLKGELPKTIFHCGKMYTVREAFREHMFSVAIAAVNETPAHGERVSTSNSKENIPCLTEI